MKRRQFLALAAALATAPAFIRRAFADQSIGLPNGRGLAGALDEAKRLDRPLLVLVIPRDDQQKYERGVAFGQLLNYGSDQQLAPLSSVEVICAGMDEVRRIAPDAPAGEPLMVLLRPNASGRMAMALDAKLPPHDRFLRGEENWDAFEKEDEKLADARIARLASLLAPLGSGPDVKAQAATVRARLVKRRIPGSHWATASGCGEHVEDDPNPLMIACGMGHVPAKSQRFVYLYAKTPSERMREERQRDKAQEKK